MNPERRFVFDTNVLVSAFLLQHSIPRKALDRSLALGKILRSDETLNEVWEVLVRPKFDRYVTLSDRIRVLKKFEQLTHRVLVTTQVSLCRDPKDDKFLSLALEGMAECIVSGDQDLLVLNGTFATPILTPAAFLIQSEKS